jgi:hypothetical protein
LYSKNVFVHVWCLYTKRVKKTRLLPNHKLYSFNCFVLNDSFSTKLNDRKNITTQYFFSLSFQTKNNFYIFSTTQALFYNTLYIIRILHIYSDILYRCKEEAKNWKTCFFFQTGTIRSEVSSLLSVFSRIFYKDAHVGGIRRKA